MDDYADDMTQHQKCDKVRACVHAQMLCILRVFMFVSLYFVVDVVCLMLVLSALVVLLAVLIQCS